MQRSDERILTTHTGKPRPADLMPLLTGAENSGTERDRQRERVGAAVREGGAEARSDQFRSDLTDHRQAETRS